MRLLLGSVVALSMAAVAAPLVAVRSASRTDGMPDGGTVDGGSTGDAGVTSGASSSAGSGSNAGSGPARPMQRVEVHPNDGGPTVVYVGDRRGSIRAENSASVADGGTIAASDAGNAQLADLKQQIATLQARTAELQARQSQSQDQVQLLQQMNEQLRTLNAQMSQAQGDRAAQAADSAAQRQQMTQAINGLAPAMEMLQSGNGQIGSALDAADQSFPPQARQDLAAAREAIANSNLGLARGLIQTAIGDAQAGR